MTARRPNGGGGAPRAPRPERFGAFVPLTSPPALVAVDRAMATRLGVDGGALWQGPQPTLHVPVLTAPTEVHLAVTERCPAGCSGCYADATPRGHEPTFAELTARLDALRDMGVFSVAFGGGEASLRPDIGALGEHARRIGLMATLTTSGLGIDEKSADALAAFAQINVSWDGPADLYRAVRGYDGAARAEGAMRALRDAGIPMGINTVLTRETYGHLDEIGAGAAALGAVELQLLRYKPSGRGRLLHQSMRLTAAQVDAFGGVLRRLAERTAVAVRIDCALVPFLAASGETSPEELSRFAVMGCEAGRSLMTLDARGHARPCSFWQDEDSRAPEPAPIDAPIAERSPSAAWRGDATLERFRDYLREVPEPCRSCDYVSVCRGGCRIVAGAAEPLGGALAKPPGQGAFRPDPECPRVRRFSEADKRSASSAAGHDD